MSLNVASEGTHGAPPQVPGTGGVTPRRLGAGSPRSPSAAGTCPCRHHHGADYDHAQHHRQDLLAPRVLRDSHGPVRDRVLPVRLRRPDGVRRPQLLLQLQEAHGREEAAEGECGGGGAGGGGRDSLGSRLGPSASAASPPVAELSVTLPEDRSAPQRPVSLWLLLLPSQPLQPDPSQWLHGRMALPAPSVRIARWAQHFHGLSPNRGRKNVTANAHTPLSAFPSFCNIQHRKSGM